MTTELTDETLAGLPIAKKLKILALDKVTCIRCGTIYCRTENFGRWACSQHAVPPIENEHGRHFSCCNRKYGCIPSDHTVISENFRYGTTDDEEITLNCVPTLKPKEFSVVRAYVRGMINYLKISRFDREAHDDIVNTM